MPFKLVVMLLQYSILLFLNIAHISSLAHAAEINSYFLLSLFFLSRMNFFPVSFTEADSVISMFAVFAASIPIICIAVSSSFIGQLNSADSPSPNEIFFLEWYAIFAKIGPDLVVLYIILLPL